MMHDDEDLVKRHLLRQVPVCPTCRVRFKPEAVGVFGHEGSLWLMVVVCEHCHSYHFASAIRPEKAPPTSRPAADVLKELLTTNADRILELPTPMADKPGDIVTVDDVLDMHNFLENFSGDINQLFSGGYDTNDS